MPQAVTAADTGCMAALKAVRYQEANHPSTGRSRAPSDLPLK
jgi:hypothetical protein